MKSVAALSALIFVAVAAGQTKQETLSYTSPRPIRDAIVDFEKKYGWVITYEEPRFQFSELAGKWNCVPRGIDSSAFSRSFKPGCAIRVG